VSGLTQLARLGGGGAVPLAAVSDLAWSDFAAAVVLAVERGLRVVAYFGTAAAGGGVELHAVLADDRAGNVAVAATVIEGGTFPSLTSDVPQVHLFEREIAEQTGLRPEGHPWLAPVRFHGSYRAGHDAWGRPEGEPILPGDLDFYRVEGEEVHEVAVGPVHAGVIEPGHFRFQCHGEEVFHLEISLGYQHRGAERAVAGGPDTRTIHYLETVAGDTTAGHATAYCEALEALSGCAVPARAQALRAVALELERVASHVGDLGALAGDVGFLPSASFCGRIRGDFLNLTAEICGSRFGRGLLRPGGVGFDLEPAQLARLRERLERAATDARVAIELLWETPSVMARFEATGALPGVVAQLLGLKGPSARACGLDLDARRDHPTGLYRSRHIPVALAESGDVYARAWVRWLEIQHSLTFLREELGALPAGPVRAATNGLAPRHLAVSLVEGWRGEICHVAITDARGAFSRYKIVDPSFHNWSGLAYALRGQQISDFPLCNKSFNLSYCGHDL